MKKLNFIHKSPVKMTLILVAVASLLVAGISYADQNSSIQRTYRMATSHQPENFTELYFTDYKSLPKSLKVGRTYAVPFTISNHESKKFTYTYRTELTGTGKEIVSAPVSVVIDNGKSVQQTAHIKVKQPNDQVELVIRVLNKNLTIHYKAQS